MSSERPQDSDEPQNQVQSERGAPTPLGPSGEKSSSRRVAVDLPGAYSAQYSWQITVSPKQWASLTKSDQELFWLASEINECAESARDLILGESDCPPADIETAKSIERARMQRMLLAWFGLRAESEAPYRDARMLLTSRILHQAGALRSLRDGSGVSPPSLDGEQAILNVGAVHASRVVAALYPALAIAMRDPDRLSQIRAAIASSATSEKKTPWVLIAAVWKGIEKGEPDPERWRKDWYEHQHSHRP